MWTVLGVGRSVACGCGRAAAGWRQGPDGRSYPPINGEASPPADVDGLAELTELINSGAMTAAIDEVVDDPELAV
jgi:hypothetical protein